MLLGLLLQDSLLSNLIEGEVIQNASLASMLLENFHNLQTLLQLDLYNTIPQKKLQHKKKKYRHNLQRCKSFYGSNTSWVSLELVTGLFSLFSRVICFSKLFGTSFTICHLRGKEPVHLSCCQQSTFVSKSTGPVISASPTNCPLALTWKTIKQVSMTQYHQVRSIKKALHLRIIYTPRRRER